MMLRIPSNKNPSKKHVNVLARIENTHKQCLRIKNMIIFLYPNIFSKLVWKEGPTTFDIEHLLMGSKKSRPLIENDNELVKLRFV